jgi:hypothetical protein
VEDYQRYSPRFGYFVTLELTAVSCGDTIFTRTPPVDATEPTAGKNYRDSYKIIRERSWRDHYNHRGHTCHRTAKHIELAD